MDDDPEALIVLEDSNPYDDCNNVGLEDDDTVA